MRAMRQKIILLAIVTITAFATVRASACTCPALPPLNKAEVEHTDTIFSGEVIKIEPRKYISGMINAYIVVDQVWKGCCESRYGSSYR